MTAGSSTVTIIHSGEDGGSGVNSPTGRRSLPSPWAQVVRGVTDPIPSSPSPPVNPVLPDPVVEPVPVPETETVVAETQPEGSDNCNAGGVKKSAWNKPSVNGVVDATTTPVMGAASWPALSESTRPGVKSSSSSTESSSKPTSDGSITVSQAPAVVQPPPKHVRTNANPNSNNPNHRHPIRQQRPMRRGGATGGYNRPPPPPPLPPPFPLFDMSYGNLVPPPPPPVGEPPHFKGNNWSPRNPTLRNNFGPRPHVNNGYSGTRDHHDRDRRSPRGPHPMVPPPPPPVRGFMRQPHPGPAPFIPPQSIRPFGTPMGYEMGASYLYVPTLPPEPYRGPPILPHAPAGSMFMPVMDPPLHILILNQIEYYFSDENLVKDNFLRSQMDEEGWVSIALIAGFHRVQNLTKDIQMILNSLRDSTIVEIQGEKVRRRSEWKKWIQSFNKLQEEKSSQLPPEATADFVEEASSSIQKMSLEETFETKVGESDPVKVVNGEMCSEDACL